MPLLITSLVALIFSFQDMEHYVPYAVIYTEFYPRKTLLNQTALFPVVSFKDVYVCLYIYTGYALTSH